MARGVTVTLTAASRKRKEQDTAARLLACCISEIGRHVEAMLLSESHEIRRLVRMGILARSQFPRRVLSAESRTVLSRMRRIQRNPLPAARRQLRHLVEMLDGEEFRELSFSEERVVALVEPAVFRRGDRPIEPFRILFVPLSRSYFPIVIRLESPEGSRHVFQRFGGHGECWGKAGSLLQKTLEKADVQKMFLIAFSWALQNLPKEKPESPSRVSRRWRALRLPDF